MKRGVNVPQVKRRDSENTNPRKRIYYSSSFGAKSLTDLYVEDKKFRQLVDSGRYVLVNGKVVLKSPECVIYDDGQLRLSEIVEFDDKDYCLHYRRVVTSRRSFFTHYRKPPHHIAHRVELSRTKLKLENAQKINSVNDVTLDNIRLILGEDDGGDDGNKFNKEFTRIMETNKVTVEQLSSLSGLEPKTIQRMRRSKQSTSKRSIIAACVALNLNFYNSTYLLDLAGYKLTDSIEDRAYSFILQLAYRETVGDCNRMLKRLGLKPLSRL